MSVKIEAMNYSAATAPAGYRCTGCGASGVKLWRQYQTFLDHIELLCAACACKDQKQADTVDAQGYHEDELVGRCDQIGWLVPAVPTEDGESFWGYTSVPQAGVTWWRNLPTRQAPAAEGEGRV